MNKKIEELREDVVYPVKATTSSFHNEENDTIEYSIIIKRDIKEEQLKGYIDVLNRHIYDNTIRFKEEKEKGINKENGGGCNKEGGCSCRSKSDSI